MAPSQVEVKLLCREGFDQFDFEANTQWRQFRANLEIPMGTDMDAALLKLRAKWYKRHVVSKTRFTLCVQNLIARYRTYLMAPL